MKFHLNYSPKKFDFEIGHSQSLFLIGSCFAENIGQKLKETKFNVRVNPNGILFNPNSIFQALHDAITLSPFEDRFSVERDGYYFSFLHHSKIKASSIKELQQHILDINLSNHHYLKSCDYMVITFGTAYHYHHKNLNATVANCHKQAQQTFVKKLLSPAEITEQFNLLCKELTKLNPGIKLILTVSPVKHLKDGLLENSLSKSTLLLSVHELCKTNKNCVYFPAFELVTDDLRDYRFYKEDLAHPNEQAVKYVWEKFAETCFNSITQKTVLELEKLNSFLQHQNLHTGSKATAEFQHFIKNQQEIIQHLNPQIVF